jgi:hypothetical protein
MTSENPVSKTVESLGLNQVVPTVYQDTLQPLAKQAGKALETIGRTVNAALSPIKVLVSSIEWLEEDVEKRLTQNLKEIPQERIQTPHPTIAGPALEALRFAVNEPSLRDLFINLLSTSMDVETAYKAHPAFVEIIRQLTPDEARVIEFFVNQRALPLISINAYADDGKTLVGVLRHFSLIGKQANCVCPELVPSYLDNLSRLGIVEILHGRLQTPGIYESLMSDPDLQWTLAGWQTRSPQIVKECVRITSLGMQFCAACLIPRKPVKKKRKRRQVKKVTNS